MALPALARNTDELVAMARRAPVASIVLRGGAEVTQSSVSSASVTRRHLLAAADDPRLFDPRVEQQATSASRSVGGAEARVSLDVHAADIEPLHGVASLDDAEKAVARLVLEDGHARGVLPTGDGVFHAGRLQLQEGVAYIDAEQRLRHLPVGARGFENTTFNFPEPYHGNPPIDVVPQQIGSLALRDNVALAARSSFTPSISLRSDSPVEVAWQARAGELQSVIGRDGMLRLAQA